MSGNVFGNSSNSSEHKLDLSLFVHRPCLRRNYIESKIEEDIDSKNQFRIKTLPELISNREAASKNYVDYVFEKVIDFNDLKLVNIKFLKINYQPAVNEHLTPKKYVDNAIDKKSLVRYNQDNDFNNQNLTNINRIILYTQALNTLNDIEVITKAYVDQFHNDNERNRRDLGLGFYDASTFW